MTRSLALIPCTTLAVLIAISLGCGGEAKIGNAGVKIRGKVVKGGAPLEVPRRDIGLGSVELHLVPADESVEPQVAMVAEDGSFEIVAAGQGIAPGSYKLAVYQQNEGPGSDLLMGKFSKENSPISIDVPSDKVGGELDLGTIELDDHQ